MENNKKLGFIPAAYALGMAPHVYYILRMFPGSDWQWTNVAPRKNWETLRAKVPHNVFQQCFRANGAHINALEGFPIFAAAILASHVTKMASSDVHSMAWQYLGLRTLYTVAYIGIKNEAASYIRTGLWGWSLALPMLTIMRCARHAGDWQ